MQYFVQQKTQKQGQYLEGKQIKIMKTNYVSIKSAISDWVEDTGVMELSDSVLKRWAMSAIEELTTTDQLTHNVMILDLKNYKVKLPDEFKMVCQLSYRENKPENECYSATQVSQWVQDAADGCEIEINIKCDKCKKVECSCSSKRIEVNIDRVHEMAHPEYYYRHFHKVRHWGSGSSTYNPNFQLMKPFGDRFRSQHMPGCLNLSTDSNIRYSIEDGYISSNMEQGEILISYLGYKTDEDGFIMIPNHRAVFEAIFFYLEYKWFWKEWRRTGTNSYRTRYRDAKVERIEAIGTARSALEIPDYDEFNQWVTDSWLRRLPNRGYEVYSEIFK